jgi:F-type H+-transporting ATPase subunit a
VKHTLPLLLLLILGSATCNASGGDPVSHTAADSAAVLHGEPAAGTDHGTAADHATGDAGGHGEGEHSSGEVIKHNIEHHLVDLQKLELPGKAIETGDWKIRAPFLDGMHAATSEGNPIIKWRVDSPAGEAYIPISKHIVYMWLGGALVFLVLMFARRSAGSTRPRGIGNLVEVFIVFIRDEVVLPNTGAEGLRYMPFFLTTFFFILGMNLLGMVPFGASATGNLSVTLGLALCSFGLIQWAGIRAHGFGGHFKGLMPHGVPIAVAPILLPIEFLGMFTKPFALCVRLFANMMAGHAVLAAFMGLILVPLLALGIVPFAMLLSILELFVAFLQAYVFVMLTAIFVGGSIHQH